ncbi:MAG: Fe-S protein assembly co-chaperone HscB [Proteobacteria bacterium]|jgi:molecular chaperone HscB|nr:Fe-S protein assembly co-chaperone HscB [Pseudomonadota bacterium]
MDLTQNHFELFGFPVTFDIDTQQLTERYRDLQRTLHPDRFANVGDRERRLSIQRTAQVNEAFQTLKSPLQRARYLLQLKGVSFDDERDTHLKPAFLMEQIELRETLAAIPQQDDALTALNDFVNDIRSRKQTMEARLQALLVKDDPDSLGEAKQTIQEMQFLARLQQEADETEEILVGDL